MPTKLQLLSKKNRLTYMKKYLWHDFPGFRCHHLSAPNYYAKSASLGYRAPKQTTHLKQPKGERAEPKLKTSIRPRAAPREKRGKIKRVRFV